MTGSLRGVVWLQHGFARGPRHLAGLAHALAGRGLAVDRPALASLSPRHSLHDVVHLTGIARRLRARADSAGVPLIAIGHSAGGAAVAAGTAGGVQGLVLLDPVDTVGGILDAARPELARRRVPMAVVVLDPSRCNRRGATAESLAAAIAVDELAGVIWRQEGLGHADPERIPADLRPSSVPAAGLAVRLACGSCGTLAQVAGLGRLVVDLAEQLVVEVGP